jgi:hypothetical protein
MTSGIPLSHGLRLLPPLSHGLLHVLILVIQVRFFKQKNGHSGVQASAMNCSELLVA